MLLKKLVVFCALFSLSGLMAIDPTSPTLLHQDSGGQGLRCDSNHAIAPEEQRRMEDDHVTIQTQDGQSFQVQVSLIKQSITIKNLIEDAGIDNPIPLPNVNSKIWAKIQYGGWAGIEWILKIRPKWRVITRIGV